KGIFAREEALLPDFLPEELPFRQGHLQEMARALLPLAKKNKALNLFLHGPTGSGKTSAAKHVLHQLSAYSDNVNAAYVNCWQTNSRQSVFSQIAESIGEVLPRRGIGADEVFNRVIQSLKREEKTLAVVLDEADRVFFKGEEKLLYDLARSQEQHDVRIAVVCISNNAELFAKADERIRSSLRPLEVAFEKYSPIQLKEILRQRGKTAFVKGACSEKVIAICAAHAARLGGDARIALETLWHSGKNAQSLGASEISEKDVRQTFEKTGLWKKKQQLESASKGEKVILGLLEAGPLTSGELYKKFKQIQDESDRNIRNHLEKLEKRKLVSMEDVNVKESRGKTRVIQLS
ncbi:MAG: Cdc6/Cdc18 family protein, partial [Candidatus Micrarchaeia archaeon]